MFFFAPCPSLFFSVAIHPFRLGAKLRPLGYDALLRLLAFSPFSTSSLFYFHRGVKEEGRREDVIKGARLRGAVHYITRVSFEWQGRRARGGCKNDLR